MNLPRFLSPDEWSIEDHPRGWDLRCMPWIGPVGPRGALAIFAVLGIVVVLTTAVLIGNHLRGPPIPILLWLFVVMLVLLKQLLLYFACWNPNRHITARDGRVACLAGTFPEGCLGSLRLSRSRHGRNRSRLVFTGTRIADVELIDEPGLPDAVASQLLQELLKRVEHAVDRSSAEHCEPPDAMASRASSREIASTSVAS